VLNGGHVALRFGLKSAGVTTFSLFDMQGRAVRTFNLGQRAAGAYSETLDVEGLSRGRYVGVLRVGGKLVNKSLLVKR